MSDLVCGLLAFSIGTTPQRVNAGAMLRQELWASMKTGQTLPHLSACPTPCDILVQYPDGKRYCFRFGSAKPTLRELPE